MDETKPSRFRAALSHARALKAQREALKKPHCACCLKPTTKLVKDHNHESMHWRGEVCYSCNAFIGYVEWTRQNPEKTEQIMRYLSQYDPEHGLLKDKKSA